MKEKYVRYAKGIILINILLYISAALVLGVVVLAVSFNSFKSTFNKQISYQDKITDADNVAPVDGSYNMIFKIYTSETGGSPIWTETKCFSKNNGKTCNGKGKDQRVVMVDGLFSTMLGSVSSLSAVDFTQKLYLEITVGGNGNSPIWEAAKFPRKLLGSVSNAFDSDKLDGRNEAEFALLSGRAGAQTLIGGITANEILILQGNSSAGNSSSKPNIQFKVGDSGKIIALTILNNGNIGIGTTSPDGLLQVVGGDTLLGTGNFTHSSDNEDLYITGNLQADGSAYVASLFSIGNIQTDADLTVGGTLGITGSLIAPNVIYSISGVAGRIMVSGGQNPAINIASDYIGQTSITTLGTITTGVWHGSPIESAWLALTVSDPITLTSGAIGLAYNTTNLKLSTGALDTVQDITTASSPTFAGLTLSNFNSAGFVKNNASGVLSGGNTIAASDIPTSDIIQSTGMSLSGTLTNRLVGSGSNVTVAVGANVPLSVSNDTNVTGTIATNVLTLGWSGLLGISRGGTNNNAYTLNKFISYDGTQLLSSAYDSSSFVEVSGDTMIGSLNFSGVVNDITTSGSEDLTINAGGTGKFVVADNALFNGTLGIIEGGLTPSKYTYLQGGDQAIDLTYTLPIAYPLASGYVLSSTDGGVMSWASVVGANIWTDGGVYVYPTNHEIVRIYDVGTEYTDLQSNSNGYFIINSSGNEVVLSDGEVFYGSDTANGLATIWGTNHVTKTNSYVRVGSGTTTHAIGGGNSLLVSGNLEVDGTTYFDGGIVMGGNLDMNNYLVLNIGSPDTDFTAGGGLNIAAALDVNGATTLDQVTIDTTDGQFQVSGTNGVDINPAGALSLNSSASAINIGNNAINQNINLGTAGTRTITIGKTDLSSTEAEINGALVDVNAGTTGMTVDSGAAIAVNANTTIDVQATTGLTIDSAGATAIGIGTDDNTGAINIGTNVSARTMAIGNSNAATTLALTGGDDWSITAGGLITTASNIAVNGGNITSSGDLTINPAGGQLYLADSKVINIGGVQSLSYNAISNLGGAASHPLANDNDLYIQGMLEVDGVTYYDGGIVMGGNLDMNNYLVLNIGSPDTDFTAGGGLNIAAALDVNGATTLDQVTIDTTDGQFQVSGTNGVDINPAGALSLNSSASAINIGNNAINQNINLGTAGTRTITIGKTDLSSTEAEINGALVDVNAGTTGMTVDSGGQISIDSSQAAANAINISASSLTGGINIDSYAGITMNSWSGAINIGSDTDAYNINIGTGQATRTISLGQLYASINLDGIGISLDATSTSNFSMTANDAADKTLTFAATNSGAGVGNLSLSADGSLSLTGTSGILLQSNTIISDGMIFYGSNASSGIATIWGTNHATKTNSYVRVGSGTTTHSIGNGNSLLVSGDLEVDGSSYYDGSLTVTGNILPGTDDLYTLGDNTHRWKDIFLGGETIHLGASTADELTISYTSATDTTTIQNTVDSITGFQFLDANGGIPILNIDTDNERVGIGTASPNEQLELTGNFRLPVTTANTGQIKMGADRWIDSYGTGNLMIGTNGAPAGNVTLTGTYNIGIGGDLTLSSLTSGGGNLAIGRYTGKAITTGSLNSIFGYLAGTLIDTASYNIAIGPNALESNVSADSLVAIGWSALQNTTGIENTAVGTNAGQSITTGRYNTAFGSLALQGGTVIGDANTAIGRGALFADTSGASNTAVGLNSLFANTSGSNNVAVGQNAGLTNATGSNNTLIGMGADVSVDALTNAAAIGYGAIVGASNSLVLGGTGANAVNVGVGTTTPRRYLDVLDATNPQLRLTQADGTVYTDLQTTSSGYLVLNSSGNKIIFSDGESLFGSDAANGLATLWGSSNATLTNSYVRVGSGTTTHSIGNGNSLLVSGDLEVDGSSYYDGSLTVTGNILPGTDDLYTLGDNTHRWKDIFLGGETIHLGASTADELTISYTSATDTTTIQNIVDSITGFQFLDANGGIPILNIDTTNERLGVGTATPNNTIQVTNLVNFYDAASGTFLGYQAGAANASDGLYNTLVGYQVGTATTTGDSNTAIGYRALFYNTTGGSNTAIGNGALLGMSGQSAGDNNVALGVNALLLNTGNYNTAVGNLALYNNTGTQNTASGYGALYFNTTGNYNTASGQAAMRGVSGQSTGSNNSAFGYSALYGNTSGGNNTVSGYNSLYYNTTGSNNTAIGYEAGRYYDAGTGQNTTASNSVYLGYDARPAADGETNEIVIGYQARGNGSNSVTLGNTSITTTVLQGSVGIGDTDPTEAKLVVGSAGVGDIYATFATSANTETLCWDGSGASLITDCTSLSKFKENVENLSLSGLDTVMKLSPREYDWIGKEEGIKHDLGFVAEEVEKVSPLLASYNYDINGNFMLNGVKYERMSALLVKAVQELKVTSDNLAAKLNHLEIVDDVLTMQKLVVTDFTTITGKLIVDAQVVFNADSVGEAKVLAGVTDVEVVFEHEYEYQPIITISNISGSTNLTNSELDELSDVNSIVTDVTTHGFKIHIKPTQTKDTMFSWHAFGSDAGKISISDGTTKDIPVIGQLNP